MATRQSHRPASLRTPSAQRYRACLTGATLLVALLGAMTYSCSPPAEAATQNFRLTSPDISAGSLDARFMLNAFGCTGGNRSPALAWSNAPAGTRRFAIQMIDLDAPTGSGFWHWAVYDLPATATGLPRGAGNSDSALPAPAYSGSTDFRDTGVPAAGGGYAGPCPPSGDAPHRYRITLYAYADPALAQAGGIPRSASPALYSFVLNKGLAGRLLGKASLVARSRR